MTTAANENKEGAFVEPRWPIVLVVATYLGVVIALPDRPTLGPSWLVPGVEVGLLVALLHANPAHIEGRARWLRHVTSLLIIALTKHGLQPDRRHARKRLGEADDGAPVISLAVVGLLIAEAVNVFS